MIRLGEAGDPRKWRGAARGAKHFSPAYLVFVTPGEVPSSRDASLRSEKRERVNKRRMSRKAMSDQIPDVFTLEIRARFSTSFIFTFNKFIFIS